MEIAPTTAPTKRGRPRGQKGQRNKKDHLRRRKVKYMYHK